MFLEMLAKLSTYAVQWVVPARGGVAPFDG
jgi:hypothetical protein